MQGWATLSSKAAAADRAKPIPLLRAHRPERGRLNAICRADQAHRGARPTICTTGAEGAVQGAPRPATRWRFIVGSEIYDHLEKVVDRFEDVANEISGIVIEHV